MNNVHEIQFGHCNTFHVTGLFQWDVGQIILFKEQIPDGSEIQFFDGSSKLVVNGVVALPDKFLQTSGEFRAWVQVIGSDNETTVKEIIFTVTARQKKNDYIEPEDEETFREQLQGILNEAKTVATEAKETAQEAKTVADAVKESADSGAFDGQDYDHSSEYTALHAEMQSYQAQVNSDRTAISASVVNAKTSEDNAKTYADNARSSELKAKTSEQNAKTYADNALDSAQKASVNEQNASAYYLGAVTAEGNAKTYADNAKVSERNSSVSEQKAKVSEINASTSELNSKKSETNSKESEDKAKVSETNASTSALNAKTSEDNAKTSELNSKTSEDNASSSATSASQSATSASESASEANRIKEELRQDLANYQPKLSSGENIKTLNKKSILGSGDIDIPIDDVQRRLTNLEASAKGIVYTETTDTDSGYSKTVPAGASPWACLNEYGGKTVKFNQVVSSQLYVKRGYVESTGLTISVDDTDKTKILVSGTSLSNNNLYFYLNFDMVNGHKYYVKKVLNKADYGIRICSSNSLQKANEGEIINTTESNKSQLQFWFNKNVDCTCEFKPQIFDLTAMFGAGNEPTTSAEIEEMFPADYYPYSTGELKHSIVDEIDVVGKNLFESQESNGTNSVWLGSASGQAHIELEAGNYTISAKYVNNVGAYLYALKEGENNHFARGDAGTSLTFTLTEKTRCRFMAYYGGLTPSGIEWFMLEKGSSATAYSPYTKTTKPIPTAIKSLDGYGIGISDTVRNYVDFARKKFVKLVGSVDLGTLSWAFNSYNSEFIYFSSSITDGNVSACICSKYKYFGVGVSKVQGSGIASSGSNIRTIYIRDDAYTDASAFKTSVNGVMLYYELAEPVETDISEYLTDDFQYIPVEAGGTVIFHQTDDDFHIPVPNSITYQTKVVS